MSNDVWIPSACGMCYSSCGILVHRLDGVVKKIEGNPECPNSRGRICPKGLSGIMLLYDPNRVNFPLKRTNPEKGIGIDPGWVRISWKEALQTITEKLLWLRQEDPRKLFIGHTVTVFDQGRMAQMFGAAFGTPNGFASGAGNHCGSAEHLFGGLLHAAWAKQPDFDHCNYLLNFGVPSGTGAYYCVSGMAQRLSDARARGMKHVVIDPMLNMAAEKADEWIPIRPGTDGALAMALLNLLLNELNIYDSDYLKHHTNAPYLIAPDGFYLRDKLSGKPLIWDPADSKAKTYDDPSIKDFALTGEFPVDSSSNIPLPGRERPGEGALPNIPLPRRERLGEGVAKTAFSLLKDHVRRHTPESASQITGIPPETIRRIASEFGSAARIGSTIILEGKELPYRPVSVLYFKGAQGHKNATLTSMAIELLAEVVGASNVPGGILGMNSRSLGYPGSGKPSYIPSEGPDGFMVAGAWLSTQKPYPLLEPRKPETHSLKELVPTAIISSPLNPLVMLEPEKFRVPYGIEFFLHLGTNYMMTLADPEIIARAFKNVFTVSFSLYLDESTEMSDVVLPDACYLERLGHIADRMFTNSAVGEWGYHIRQPVVSPLYERRDSQEVFLELAERLGLRKELYHILNSQLNLVEPYQLNPGEKYSLEEIVDRRYKSVFGEAHGLEWFKQHGVLKWPKKVEEVYWKPFVHARVPIYFELFKTVGQQVKKITQENNIAGFDISAFQPLPDWNPCASHQEKRSDFDLYAIYFRVPVQTFSSTYNNPWLDEASRVDPYVYNIAINAQTAHNKGIKDGDLIVLESSATHGKVKGRARLTEALHPDVVAMANCGGHWAKGLPLASQSYKGACFEWLLPLSLDSIDIPTFNQDLCVKVRLIREG